MRRTLLLLFIAATSASTAPAQDAFISQLDVAPYAGVGQPVHITGYLRNASGPAVTSFLVSWRWKNGPVQKGNSINLGPNGLSGDNMAMFKHAVPFEVKGRETGMLKVWVEAPGDPNRGNDTVKVQVTGLDRWVPKRNLMEVRTSLACHNCLGAQPRLAQIATDANVVLAKFHYRDGLTVPAADAYFDTYATQFTPAGVVDQGEYGGYAPNPNQSQWQNHLKKREGGVSPVLVWAEPLLDTVTNKLHVTVAAEFLTKFKGDLAVNALILRNNVHAPWEAGPGDPWNQRVVQVMLGGPDGDAEVIPQEPAVGTTYKVTWDMEWPQGIDFHDICVVGLVTHYDRGGKHTMNAREACVNRGRAQAPTAWMPVHGRADGDLFNATPYTAPLMGRGAMLAVLPARTRSARPEKGTPRA